MPTKPTKNDYHNAALELTAAATAIDPLVERLDNFLLYMRADPEWHKRPIPEIHRIHNDDTWSAHEVGEKALRKYDHLFSIKKDEWTAVSWDDWLMVTVEGTRKILNRNRVTLAKYAAVASEKAGLAQPLRQPRQNVHHHHYGDTSMRDLYKGNVGAAFGPQATATNTVIQVWQRAASEVDLQKLAESLGSLRPQLRAEPDSGEHDEEIGQVAAAEKAATAGDGRKALEHLKEAGKWVFEVAPKIGESVAANVIATALGLPSI